MMRKIGRYLLALIDSPLPLFMLTMVPFIIITMPYFGRLLYQSIHPQY